MESTIPKASFKHHYLPVFYLKGFTDEKGQYYVYDKETGKIFISNPTNTFYEKHRNTGSIVSQINGETETSDLPETMVTHFDNKAAFIINKLRKTTAEDNALQPEVLYELMMFIHSIFWRTPANDGLREHIISQSSFKDLGFGIFDREGNRSVNTEEMMKGIDLFQKIYPVLLPLTSFINGNYKADWKDWKLFYSSNDVHIVSDNPVMYKDMTSFSGLQHNIIFPVSSKIFLISSPQYPAEFKFTFPFMIDLYLFATAKRFVACKHKEYLEYLKNENDTTVKENGVEALKFHAFKHLIA